MPDSVSEVKLANTPPETWVNTIMYRLAEVLGYEPKDGVIQADIDVILDEAVDAIWRYRDLEF